MCVCVCVYIYVYIYIYKTGFILKQPTTVDIQIKPESKEIFLLINQKKNTQMPARRVV